MPNLINRNVNWQGCLEKGSGFPISKLTTYGSVALNRLGTQYLKSPSKRFIGGDTEYEYYPNTTFLRNPIVVKNHQFGLSHKAHSFQQMPKESYSDYKNPQTWDNGNNNKKKPYKHKKPGYTENSDAGEDWGFNTCKMGVKCDCNSFEAPERAAPERAAPERPVPERAAPERPVPERAAPERPIPERAAPERATPERAPPDFGATERETASNSQPSKQHPRHYAEGVENSTYPYSCLLRNPMLDPKRQTFNTNEYTDNSYNRGSRGNNNNHQNEPEPQENKSPKNNGAGQNSIKFDPCCYQESCPNRKYDDRERPARGMSRKQRSNFEDSSSYNNYTPPQARQSSARRRTSAADENYAYKNNQSNVRDPISAASDGSPINAAYKKPKNEFMVERIYNAHYPTQYEYSTLGNAVAKVQKKNGKTSKRPQPNGSTYTKDNNGQCPRRPTKNPAKSSKKQADTNELMYTNESNCYHPKNTIVQCASLNHYAPEPAANNLNFNSNRCDQCEHCNQSNNMGNSRKNMSREKRLQESTRYSNRRNSAGTAGSTSTARSNCADAVANKNRCASSSSRRSCADAPCSTNRSASSSSRRKSANAAGNKKKPTSSSIRRKSAGASGNITNTNVLPKNGILSKKPKETNNSVVLKIEQGKDEQSAKDQTNNDKPCSEAQKVLPTTKSVISCPALNRYKAMQYKMKCVGPKKSNSHTTVNSNETLSKDNIPRKFKDTMGTLENDRSNAGTCTPFVKSVVRAIEENIEKSKQEAALQSSAFIMPCQLELRRQFKSYAKKEAGCAHAYGNCCRRAVCSNPRRFWYNFWNWKKFFYCGAHHKLTSSFA